ncbi:MAG: hypothetical protein ACLSIL_10635 [Enterococcus casseliflavus]
MWSLAFQNWSPLVFEVLLGNLAFSSLKAAISRHCSPGGSCKSGRSRASRRWCIVMLSPVLKAIVVAAGDMKNAKRNLPKAVATVMTVVLHFLHPDSGCQHPVFWEMRWQIQIPIQTRFR